MPRPITVVLVVVGAVVRFLILSGILLGILLGALVGGLLGCLAGVVVRPVTGVLVDIVRGGGVVAGATVHLGQRFADRIHDREARGRCPRRQRQNELHPDRSGKRGP